VSGLRKICVRVWTTVNILGLEIADLGVGFDPGQVLTSQKARGLTGIRERAALIGGQMKVESNLGEGTRVTAQWQI
jgi:signal transduction histidine kinase